MTVKQDINIGMPSGLIIGLLHLCIVNYFIIFQMNPYIKNCRTGYHDDILNRTSHYLKLLNTKSAIVNKQQDNYLYLLKQHSKDQNQLRVTNNYKLANSLQKIKRKYSTYGFDSERDTFKRRATLKNQYEERQKQLSLFKDNKRLYKKLVQVDSQISHDKMKKFDSDVTRYSNLIKHPFKQIVEMDDRLFSTFRQVKMKVSPAKYINLADEIIIEKSTEESKINKRRHKCKRKKNKIFTMPQERGNPEQEH